MHCADDKVNFWKRTSVDLISLAILLKLNEKNAVMFLKIDVLEETQFEILPLNLNETGCSS